MDAQDTSLPGAKKRAIVSLVLGLAGGRAGQLGGAAALRDLARVDGLLGAVGAIAGDHAQLHPVRLGGREQPGQGLRGLGPHLLRVHPGLVEEVQVRELRHIGAGQALLLVHQHQQRVHARVAGHGHIGGGILLKQLPGGGQRLVRRAASACQQQEQETADTENALHFRRPFG